MHLVPRADPSCIKCGPIPACPACVTGEICQISGQSCNQCPAATCVPAPSTGGSPPSNPGTIAGTVVGVLALVGVAVGLFMFYRKRKAAALARERDEPKPVPDVPASASDVLSRPDPIEKPPSTTNTILPTTTVTATNTNFSYPMSQYIADPNPFADQASINTASERSQNVIPIAYIPPPSPTQRNANRDSDLSSTPSRPQRDPSMNLHLGTSNAQENARSSLLPPKSPLKYEPSQRSGVSGVSSRASYMSSASSAIDFVNDAPQIITPVHGHVRQVVGVVRAEVVQLPSTPSTPGGLHPRLQRPMNAGPSPLARSFASDSAGAVDDQSSLDPFADSHSRHDSQASFAHSFSSTSTFGTPRNRSAADHDSTADWSPAKPQFNFAGARPDSVGSAITADISSAKVVTLGRQSSVLHRTLADYTTPVPTPAAPNFKHLTAMTESSEFDPSRGSLASSMNRVSTTDSILEAFPFVPPEAGAGGHGQLPPSPLSPSHPGLAASNSKNGNQTFPTNPSRHTLGLSTVSSASSSALDGYTFQFSSGDLSLMPPLPSAALTDRGSTSGLSMNSRLGASEGSLADASSVIFTPTESEFAPSVKGFPRPGGASSAAPPPPSAFTMPSVTALGSGDATMRDSHASLDTLALSRELEAFPLTFDGPATPLSGSPGMSVPLPRADTFGNGTGAGKK